MAEPSATTPPTARFPRGLKARIAVGGLVWALVPWLVISNVAAWPFVLVLVYPVATLVIAFFVSLSRPLGNQEGARVGKWVIIAGLIAAAAFIPLMTVYKSIESGAPQIYLGSPSYALLVDVLFSPVFILLARFAGSVGGYQPEEAQASSGDAAPAPSKTEP